MLHGGNHTCGGDAKMPQSHPFTYSASHKVGGWNQKSQIGLHRSNVQCLCFLAQASLFLILVSFSSGFFAEIGPWPDSYSLLWTVDVEMCLLFELCEAFLWAVIWGAVNSNEHILYSRGNYGSSFPVVVLKVMMHCCFSLLIWAVLDIIWTSPFTQ